MIHEKTVSAICRRKPQVSISLGFPNRYIPRPRFRLFGETTRPISRPPSWFLHFQTLMTPRVTDLRRSAMNRFVGFSTLIFASLGLVNGCGTTTTKMATEQLLISDAVDQAISQIDFTHIAGEKVFVDTTYLKTVKGVGFVNSEYITSSLRQQLTAARCLIQDTPELADVILEPRVGALGTDGHEVVYGIPQSGSVAFAASVLSSTPVPAIPEVSVGKSNAQSGIAKVIVFAYDRETREPVWQSGIAKAESTSNNTWLLGAGPFQKGAIYEGTRFAGQELPPPTEFDGSAFSSGNLARIPRLRAENNRRSKPVFEISEPLGLVDYKQEHFFDIVGPRVDPIPAASHPEDILDAEKTDAVASPVKSASFETESDDSSPDKVWKSNVNPGLRKTSE